MYIVPMRIHVQSASQGGHHEQYSPFQSAMCKRWDTPNATRRQAQEPEAEKPEAEPPAPITMGLDVLHTERELERVLQRLWNRVERQIEAAVKADAKLSQVKRRGQDRRGAAGCAGRAWGQAERLFDEAVQAQEAVEQIKGA